MRRLLADARDQLVARAAHQVAGDLQRFRRLGGDLLGRGQHLALEIVLVDHIVDQAGRPGAVGRKALPERQQRESLLAADDRRREQARARLRHQAEIDERRAEHGARRGEGQVAMEVDRRADADRDAVDARHHRLFARGEREQEIDRPPRRARRPSR